MKTDAEDRLHLRQIRPGMRARQHLDDETTERPDVGFARVRSLFHDFGRHPVHRSLQRRSMRASEQICTTYRYGDEERGAKD